MGIKPIDGVSKLLSGKASAPEHSSDDQKTYVAESFPRPTAQFKPYQVTHA